jgi:diamine N-acetyltransferase
MEGVKLEPAGTGDIPQIAALAEKIWKQHYPSIIGDEQVAYMLGLMYSAASLREQMTAKGQQFFFVNRNGARCGFIAVEKKSGGELFISKFYIDQEIAGKGIGTAALKALIEFFRPALMRLTVNRQNFKAINFYFKNGFTIERVADFDIGEGFVMNDFVMVWKS